MNCNVVQLKDLSEPELADHGGSAGISTFGFLSPSVFQCLEIFGAIFSPAQSYNYRIIQSGAS